MKQLLLGLCKKDSVLSQSLFLLFALLFSSNVLYAEDQNDIDNTTWNMIREQFFNGENTYVSRFEDDIRFQVIGAKTYQDSVFISQLISELNGLMETVQISLVDKDPNFKIEIRNKSGQVIRNSYSSEHRMTSVEVILRADNNLTHEEFKKLITYYTVQNLTRSYKSTNTYVNLGGVFDRAADTSFNFSDVDKDIIRKLYSKNFYEKLKENIIQNFGYQYYIELRYRKLTNHLTYLFIAVLIIFVFLYFLSNESQRKPNPGFWLYYRQRFIFIIAFLLLFIPITTSGDILPLIFPTLRVLLINFTIAFVYGTLVLVLIYYLEPFFTRRIKNFISLQLVVFFCTLIEGYFVTVLLSFLSDLFSNNLTDLSFLVIWGQRNSILLAIVATALLRVFYNTITYRIQSMVNQKDVEIAKMKELKNQAELNALHSRINPHFLYNSLNSIASLAHIDADKTESMATGLSELFRYSINKENKTFVTVAEELEMVNKYLEIEKTRFGKRLVYEINTDERPLNKQIPKFLIQPLVENAIKHGLSKIKETGKLTIEIKQVDKALTIAIFDNGPDFPTEPVSGYGMQNLNDKLDIIYGEKASINWENNPNKHVKITLKNQF